MAALNRPITANYVIHERVSVDTQGACSVACWLCQFFVVDVVVVCCEVLCCDVLRLFCWSAIHSLWFVGNDDINDDML